MPQGVAALKYASAISPGGRWQTCHPEWAECLTEVSQLINSPQHIADDKLLKRANRRLVFSHQHPTTKQDFVVKAFPLEGLKRQLLKHHKYAYAEAQHLHHAQTLGLQVPALYAFGYQGLVLKRWNAVIMEQVKGREFLTVLNAAQTDNDKQNTLQRCVELFASLLEVGANHIDLKPEALIFGEDPSKDRVIDFQYCSFVNPNLGTAMAQAGHFAYWWLKEDADAEAEIQNWIELLINRLSTTHQEQDKAYDCFNQHRHSVMSIEQRLKQ